MARRRAIRLMRRVGGTMASYDMASTPFTIMRRERWARRSRARQRLFYSRRKGHTRAGVGSAWRPVGSPRHPQCHLRRKSVPTRSSRGEQNEGKSAHRYPDGDRQCDAVGQRGARPPWPRATPPSATASRRTTRGSIRGDRSPAASRSGRSAERSSAASWADRPARRSGPRSAAAPEVLRAASSG